MELNEKLQQAAKGKVLVQSRAEGVLAVAGTKALRQRLREDERWCKRQTSRFWKHCDVNDGAQSFAAGLNAYKVIWVFMLCCVAGVVFETLGIFLTEGVWMRRSGVLYGPFNQVYGLGAVAFTLGLYRFRKKSVVLIFAVGTLLGALFEYLCSLVQQLVFGSVSWEYSDMPVNFGGRTNIYYAVGWGIMGLVFITLVWPWVNEMIERIPNRVSKRVTGKALTLVLFAALALNMLLSGGAVFRAGQRQDGIPANGGVAQFFDSYYPDEVIQEKYPSMKFVGREGHNNSEEYWK